MAGQSPTPNEWSRLYQAAVCLKETAPWEWMTETDIFGVQNPETGEVGFVSVMGMLGEHYSVAVYLGPEALYRFWAFQEAASHAFPEGLLEIHHMQASFEDRSTLTEKDRDVIKSLGLRFRGQKAWPMFRSYRPGFYPWHLEAQEARFLVHALEQTMDVAPRFGKNSALLSRPEDESYLVRVSQEAKGGLAWEDRFLTVPPVEPSPIEIVLDARSLETLKRMRQSRRTLEIDFFMFPSPVQEKDDRPYFPYMLMVVDADSEMIFGSELLTPEPALEKMWEQVPMSVLYILARMGIVPRRVRARPPLCAELLQPLAVELGFKVIYSRTLRSLDRAKQFLMQRLS